MPQGLFSIVILEIILLGGFLFALEQIAENIPSRCVIVLICIARFIRSFVLSGSGLRAGLCAGRCRRARIKSFPVRLNCGIIPFKIIHQFRKHAVRTEFCIAVDLVGTQNGFAAKFLGALLRFKRYLTFADKAFTGCICFFNNITCCIFRPCNAVFIVAVALLRLLLQVVITLGNAGFVVVIRFARFILKVGITLGNFVVVVCVGIGLDRKSVV